MAVIIQTYCTNKNSRVFTNDQTMLPAPAAHCSAVGSPTTVKLWLEQFARETGADEMILAGQIYDHTARRHSFEIAAAVRERSVPAANHR